MNPIPVMINGLPGNMARLLVRRAAADPRFSLVPFSLTGPEITEDRFRDGNLNITLLKPGDRDAAIGGVTAAQERLIAVDFTHPAAVVANAGFYCRHGIPFVMGTTGGDRGQLEATVAASAVPALISPNMAKQIVGLQAMMAYGAERFPGLFEGYSLTVRESHQKGKADTSGTARAMVGYFNAMGVDFPPEAIRMERDPDVQRSEWGIPEAYLGGHGWHTYTLDSADGTVRFELTHNVNGREIYLGGTLDAVVFLAARIREGAAGKVFSMMDVLAAAVPVGEPQGSQAPG